MTNKTILSEQIEKINATFNKKVEKVTNFSKLDSSIWYDEQIINKVESYKGDLTKQIPKYIKLLTKHKFKEIEEVTNSYNAVMESEDFNGSLVLTIEWKKSAMWGDNPRVYTNYGFEGSSIGGSGYDKLSTATAEGLNNFKPILKELYKVYNKNLNSKNVLTKEVLFGYGMGSYSVKFGSGVGVSCHIDILEKLGFEMKCVTSTKTIDVYTIKRA